MLTVCLLLYGYEFPDLRHPHILQCKQLSAMGEYELQGAALQDEYS